MLIRGKKKHLVEKAAALLLQLLRAVIMTKGRAVIAVPGGRSVADIFRLLGSYPLDWQKVCIFLLDERLVADDHRESNYRLVRDSLGSAVPPGTILPFGYDGKNPRQSLSAYAQELRRCGGRFDIVLASSGEDGHIGSLFPHHSSVRDTSDSFILLDDSPKPPPGRMSSSSALLCRSETGILLFFGNEKHRALRNFLDDEISYLACPAKIITSMSHYYVFTDQGVDSQ